MNEFSPPSAALAGLDLLSTAVVLADGELLIRHLNPAAENLFSIAARTAHGWSLTKLLNPDAALDHALQRALLTGWSYIGHDIFVARDSAAALHLDCVVTPVDVCGARLMLEFRPIDHQLRAAHEERAAVQQQANRELIRNLAHEIKNPLGGIRGSAQLLERELDGLDVALREYTQVIINEADRLQSLMQRLLSSHGAMQPGLMSCHEILERVKSLIQAEYPDIIVRRDYDPSLPDITGDREQLIQAVLNIARNAAQALAAGQAQRAEQMGATASGAAGEIVLRTRAQRQVTLAKRRHRLVIELQIIDNGPGIPAAIRDRIFYPLVTGRPDGSGLGLTLAAGIIEQHHGVIEVESRPGRTCFSVRLPLQ